MKPGRDKAGFCSRKLWICFELILGWQQVVNSKCPTLGNRNVSVIQEWGLEWRFYKVHAVEREVGFNRVSLVIFALFFFFFFFFYKFIYLFIFIFGCVGSPFLFKGFLQLRQAGATLHRGARASHYRGLSCCERRLSGCDSRAQSLRGTWDPPGPGLEPASPALAGGLPTTAPPGKPRQVDS